MVVPTTKDRQIMPVEPNRSQVMTATVPNSAGSGYYEISQQPDGSWYCKCPAWRTAPRQRGLASNQRMCKHMEALVTSLGGHVVGVYDLVKTREQTAAG
jgi:hypothetical protein